MAKSIQRPGNRQTRRWVLAFVICATLGSWAPPLAAHDIPASVVVQVFARPEGTRLRILLRLPLVSMRDFILPSGDGVMLDRARLQPMLGNMARTWLVTGLTLFEDGQPLGAPEVVATRVSLPSDRSFTTFDAALAHVQEPSVEPEPNIPASEALFDTLLEYPIHSDRARFSIDPQFARFGLRVVTTLRFHMPGQPERAFQFTGDPGVVDLDPHWYQAAARFVHAGFTHILSGIDHLLFLVCLVLPLRRFWALVKVVTAFTVAHSITLACAAFGIVPDAMGFPALIEFLIALSIFYMAIENIVIVVARRSAPAAAAGQTPRGEPVTLQRRWAIAFAFGLVHGFGFSFALKETLQFAGSHLVTSLVSFNLGVELGQLAVLLAVLPLLALVFRRLMPEWLGIILASAIVADTAWHWLLDRGSTLWQYDWSIGGPAGLASLLRWTMAGVALAGFIWLLASARKFRARR
jgi:hypothetical protein